MQLDKQQADEARQAIADFKRAMELRADLNLRVARRVTAILRVGMFSFAVVAVILMGMLMAFTSRVADMIVVLDTMHYQFNAMSNDMRHMRTVIAQMDRDIQALPVVVGELGAMRQTVGEMNTNMIAMSETITGVEGTMRTVTNNVNQMNQSFRHLEPSVVGMGGNINRASEPMKTFNSFFPW